MCGGGELSKATAKSCGGCPGANAATEGEATARPRTAKVVRQRQGVQRHLCTKNCESCPAGQGDAKACQKECGTCPASKAKARCARLAPIVRPARAKKRPPRRVLVAAVPNAASGKDCKDCPITAAMKALPQMIFVVGEEKTGCPKAAAELAQKSSAPIHYAVGDKSFDNESDAKLALVEATEQFVAAFAEPKVCKESGKVSIAGKELCCENVAAQTAAVAKAAMDKVAMTYLVGEKECHCPVEAEKLAKDSGDPTIFVVAGESTGCNVTARLNLARAKYKAAVMALMQTEAQATEKLTSKDS